MSHELLKGAAGTMADEDKVEREIEFFFEYDRNYRLVAANGAWVGITSRADMRLDFFVESQTVPDSIKHRITAEDKLGEEISRTPTMKLIRQMQIGMLLSLDNAESLANFIKEKVAEFRRDNPRTK